MIRFLHKDGVKLFLKQDKEDKGSKRDKGEDNFQTGKGIFSSEIDTVALEL